MPIAEIHISHPDLVLAPTIRALSNVEIIRELQPVAIPDSNTLVLFFSVNGEFGDIRHVLEDDPTVRDPQLIANLPKQEIFRVEITDRAKVVTPRLAELSIQILEIRSGVDGWILKLQFADMDSLVTLRAFCRREGIEFRVDTLYQESPTEGSGIELTDLQRETLLIARDQGYFNDPREITLEELSEQIGISPTGVGRRLRRAIARLIDGTLI